MPSDEFTAYLSQWSKRCLSNDTLVDVQLNKNTPLQVQSAILTHATDPSHARISISWPPEPPMQPEFLAQPTLNLQEFPTSASLIFLYWLYNRRLPPSPCRVSNQMQEHINALWSDAWLLGAALGSPAFQNALLHALVRALEKEEVEAARGQLPHYSSAITWARQTWDRARVRAEGKRLADFAVDVAAKRVYGAGRNGLVLTQEEARDLSGECEFAGAVLASVGGQIGFRGLGYRELETVGKVEEV